MGTMRFLIALAICFSLAFLVACGPPEQEGRVGAATKPASTTTDKDGSGTKPAETPVAKDANGNSPAEIDKVPEKPMPGPGDQGALNPATK